MTHLEAKDILGEYLYMEYPEIFIHIKEELSKKIMKQDYVIFDNLKLDDDQVKLFKRYYKLCGFHSTMVINNRTDIFCWDLKIEI